MQEKEDVEAKLASMDKAFALFYASWCPFSQRFLPIFKEYAKNHPKDCVSIMIDFKPDLCDKYGIEYYPTVLLLSNGEIVKRLDATPGEGLTKSQLAEFTASK
jgi:Thiol-disulfide isomerase and thioredoxins